MEAARPRPTELSRRAPAITAFVVAAALAQAAPADTAGKLPVDHFTRAADTGELIISPDGTGAAQPVLVDGVASIAVYSLRPFQRVKLLRAGEGVRVIDLRWATPTRLVYGLAEVRPDRSVALGGIFAVDSDGGRAKVIHPQYSDSPFAALVSTGADDDDDVLVVEYPNSGKYTPRILRLDIYTGEDRSVEKLPEMPRDDASVLLDEDERVRAVTGDDWYGNFTSIWRHGAVWKALEPAGIERTSVLPRYYGTDEHVLYFTASHGGAPNALFRIDAESERVQQVHAHPQADVDGIVTNLGGDAVVGVSVYADRPAYHWLDPEDPSARLHQELEQAFPGQAVSITSVAQDERLAIALVRSDVNPGDYHLVDVQAGEAEPLARGRSWLDPAGMRHKEIIEVRTRDGRTLHGYLTRPRDEAGPYPLVVLPRDQPYRSRDTWDFDFEAQLLAHYGYAVLQVNYRGSAGYGEAFRNAGVGEHAGKVHDDLADATLWAIRQGVASKGNICIYGFNDGGDIALASAVRESALYACAIAYTGRIDQYAPRTSALQWHSVGIGWSVNTSNVPRRRAHLPDDVDRTPTPILLIGRTAERGVDDDDAKRMRRALEKAGKKVESVSVRWDGSATENARREEIYSKLLHFLARHLSGGSAPAVQ